MSIFEKDNFCKISEITDTVFTYISQGVAKKPKNNNKKTMQFLMIPII